MGVKNLAYRSRFALFLALGSEGWSLVNTITMTIASSDISFNKLNIELGRTGTNGITLGVSANRVLMSPPNGNQQVF